MVGRGGALLRAALIGMTIVIIGNVAVDIVLGTPFFADGALGLIDALDVALLHLAFASLPLLVLSLRGNRDPVPWFTAISLAILFQCYFVY